MSHDHHHHMMDPNMTTPSPSMGGHNHGSMKHSIGVEPHGSMTSMMQMYFDAGFEATILFEVWHTQTVGAMIGSCFGVFFMALLYEGLKFFREKLHRRNQIAIDYSKVTAPDGNGSQVSQVRTAISFKSSMLSPHHYIQTCLHLTQLVLSYFLMLIVMTFNVWLFISVIIGCTVGYFLFGWQRGLLVDITEHCH